jgi:hypothetical protein
MHIDDSKKFDKRNIQRNVKDGIITQKDLDLHLNKLPDVSEKVFVPESDTKEAEMKGEPEAESPKGSTKKKSKGK